MNADITHLGPVAAIDTTNHRTLRIQCNPGGVDPSGGVVEVKRAWSPRFDSPTVSFATTQTLTLDGSAITEIDVTDIGWVQFVVTTAVAGGSFDFEYTLSGDMRGTVFELPISMDAAGLRGFVGAGYKAVAIATARDAVTTGVLELKQAMGSGFNALSFSPAASMTLDGSTVTEVSSTPGGVIYAACTTAQAGLGADLYIYTRDEVAADSAGGGSADGTGYFNVFAEESGNVNTGTNSGFQWSFGNGDTGDSYGIVIPFACELVAVSISVDTSTSGTCTVEVYKGADADSTSSSTGVDVSLSTGEKHNYADFTGSPVTVNAGDWITFKTTAISGTITGGRVSAWFRLT